MSSAMVGTAAATVVVEAVKKLPLPTTIKTGAVAGAFFGSFIPIPVIGSFLGAGIGIGIGGIIEIIRG